MPLSPLFLATKPPTPTPTPLSTLAIQPPSPPTAPSIGRTSHSPILFQHPSYLVPSPAEFPTLQHIGRHVRMSSPTSPTSMHISPHSPLLQITIPVPCPGPQSYLFCPGWFSTTWPNPPLHVYTFLQNKHTTSLTSSLLEISRNEFLSSRRFLSLPGYQPHSLPLLPIPTLWVLVVVIVVLNIPRSLGGSLIFEELMLDLLWVYFLFMYIINF